MAEYRAIIAATWLSFFTDQSNCSFYFQSEIPEIFELYWILSCFCPKGLLNRAHVQKRLLLIMLKMAMIRIGKLTKVFRIQC